MMSSRESLQVKRRCAAPSSPPVGYKHMKATGLVRLEPHLEEAIAAVPVGGVQRSRQTGVTGEHQSETSP